LKIIILANASWNIYNYRLPLVRALDQAGHEVVLLSPRDEYTAPLVRQGLRWADLPMTRRGTNPFVELRTVLHIYSFYRREKPDLVHHFTPKAVIYGSLAAHRAGVRRIVNTITGLGYVFSDQSFPKPILQLVTRILYRLVLSKTAVVFQNAEDRTRLVSITGTQGEDFFLMSGSGVSLSKFKPAPEPAGTPLVLLAARLMPEKGVEYFVEAARILRGRGVQARFVLVGSPDPNRRVALTADTLQKWAGEGVIEWWGWRNDMEDVYPQAHIVCLPTYYGEGVPLTLLEAAACGRPLVATDIPGCRKVVRDGENGLLVPVKNAPALAQAILKLLNDAALRRSMGSRSREIARIEFSAEQHVSHYFRIYGLEESPG